MVYTKVALCILFKEMDVQLTLRKLAEFALKIEATDGDRIDACYFRKHAMYLKIHPCVVFPLYTVRGITIV